MERVCRGLQTGSHPAHQVDHSVVHLAVDLSRPAQPRRAGSLWLCFPVLGDLPGLDQAVLPRREETVHTGRGIEPECGDCSLMRGEEACELLLVEDVNVALHSPRVGRAVWTEGDRHHVRLRVLLVLVLEYALLAPDARLGEGGALLEAEEAQHTLAAQHHVIGDGVELGLEDFGVVPLVHSHGGSYGFAACPVRRGRLVDGD
mmetsp:Transcript_32593/g.81048  ORF Transcript_32593/g.81048 Transcript_32593/m.81048 type:complete len:203 (+) Transcript_32593:900-1508(+)